MQETIIGNPDLDFMFEDTIFRAKRKNRNTAHMTSPSFLKMAKLYDSVEINVPVLNNIVEATFVGQTEDHLLFEILGYKDYIRVDNRPSESKYLKNVEVGDQVDILISQLIEKPFQIKGSISTIYESRAHQNLKSLGKGEPVTVYVRALGPAGYEVDIQRGGVTLQGFMPNTLAGINKLYDPNSIIGETFEVMVESYSDSEGTYIVSRRKFLHTLIPNAISELEFNTVYTGRVTGTRDFGVFVEFNNCLTGMIHKANLHPDWQNRIGDIKPGFEIDFYVKEIIKDKNESSKVILTQILRETLWDTIKIGQTLNGTIKDIKPFGVLVNLDEEGTVGLIHSSEVDKSNKNLEAGKDISVKVLSVDRSTRKIFLTSK